MEMEDLTKAMGIIENFYRQQVVLSIIPFRVIMMKKKYFSIHQNSIQLFRRETI